MGLRYVVAVVDVVGVPVAVLFVLVLFMYLYTVLYTYSNSCERLARALCRFAVFCCCLLKSIA